MKTLVIQEVNRKTAIEYKTNSTNYSEVNDRITKIQGQALGSEINIVVESSVNSLSFISKTLVVDSTGSTSTAIVQNTSSKTFLSGVTQLTNNITQLAPDFVEYFDIPLVAGENLLSNKVLTTNELGKVVYASSLNLSSANRIVGISVTSANVNQILRVRKSGRLSNAGWNWIPKQLLYLGENGEITSNPNSGLFSNSIGYAMTQNEIFINIGRAVIRG